MKHAARRSRGLVALALMAFGSAAWAVAPNPGPSAPLAPQEAATSAGAKSEFSTGSGAAPEKTTSAADQANTGAAAAAGAGPVVSGTTFFSDGTTTKTVTRGTRVVVIATGAFPQVVYKLVMASSTNPGTPCAVTEEVINPVTRVPISSGFIPSTAGLATKVGTFQVCFVDAVANATATGPITLTVT